MDSQATVRAPRGGQGLDQKELTAMPRWFSRNENWDFGGKPDPTEDAPREPKSRKRRLATTFVFTVLFFAGASLAAVAGDRLSASIPSDDAAATDTTTTTDTATDAAPPAADASATATDDSAAAAATAAAASHDLSVPADSAAAGSQWRTESSAWLELLRHAGERVRPRQLGGAYTEADGGKACARTHGASARRAVAEDQAGAEAGDRGPAECGHGLAQLTATRSDSACASALGEVRVESEGRRAQRRRRLGDDARNPPRTRSLRSQPG